MQQKYEFAVIYLLHSKLEYREDWGRTCFSWSHCRKVGRRARGWPIISRTRK